MDLLGSTCRRVLSDRTTGSAACLSQSRRLLELSTPAVNFPDGDQWQALSMPKATLRRRSTCGLSGGAHPANTRPRGHVRAKTRTSTEGPPRRKRSAAHGAVSVLVLCLLSQLLCVLWAACGRRRINMCNVRSRCCGDEHAQSARTSPCPAEPETARES